MSGIISATNPKNGGFEGGTLARNGGNPTQASGSFTSVGTSNTPGQQIGAGSVAFARNNRGSNIRIPYAACPHARPRRRQCLRRLCPRFKRIDVMEYDGLEPGELALILGRRLMGGFAGTAGSSRLADGNTNDFAYYDNAMVSASAHAMGMGHGVDRMQRLAFTGWVESFFRQQINGSPGELAGAKPGRAPRRQCHLPPQHVPGRAGRCRRPRAAGPGRVGQRHHGLGPAFYQAFLGTGTALYAPDVPWMLAHGLGNGDQDVLNTVNAGGQDKLAQAAAAEGGDALAQALGWADAAGLLATRAGADQAAAAAGDTNLTNLAQANYAAGHQQQGLFVMERGPFLRSKPIGADASHFPVVPTRKNGYTHLVEAFVLGSDLAWSARGGDAAQALFRLVPDGIVLSKFESGPNPQADAEIDGCAWRSSTMSPSRARPSRRPGPASRTWRCRPWTRCLWWWSPTWSTTWRMTRPPSVPHKPAQVQLPALWPSTMPRWCAGDADGHQRRQRRT